MQGEDGPSGDEQDAIGLDILDDLGSEAEKISICECTARVSSRKKHRERARERAIADR